MVTGTPSCRNILTITSAPLLTSFGCQRGMVEKISTSFQGALREIVSMIGSVTSLFCM
jgi:hypothetical protein